MTFQSDLRERDLGDFGAQRVRDLAFDAVLALWNRRKAAGMRQKDLAERIGRDPGWVSTSLRGPANWTMRTFGELVAGLDGEADIAVHAIEDPVGSSANHDAYSEYRPDPEELAKRPKARNDANVMALEFQYAR